MHTSIPSFAIILDTVVKSTLLLAIAWGATLILKRRSAATQHMVRTFALAALLLLPFSVMLLPAWHIKGLPQYPKSRSTQQPAVRQGAIQASLLIPREGAAAPAKRGRSFCFNCASKSSSKNRGSLCKGSEGSTCDIC